MIVWLLDLQLPVQSASITTNTRLSWRGVIDTTLYKYSLPLRSIHGFINLKIYIDLGLRPRSIYGRL